MLRDFLYVPVRISKIGQIGSSAFSVINLNFDRPSIDNDMKLLAPYFVAITVLISYSMIYKSDTIGHNMAVSVMSADPNPQETVEETEVEKIQWMSFEEAQEANKKEPRKFIVDVYTSWCGWCKKMDASTFSHPDVVKYVNEKYYAVKFNAESKKDVNFKGTTYINAKPDQRRHAHQLASIAAVNGRLSYPTIVYLDEELNLLSQVPGFFDAKGIEPIIKYFGENAYKSSKWVDYQANFEGTIN